MALKKRDNPAFKVKGNHTSLNYVLYKADGSPVVSDGSAESPPYGFLTEDGVSVSRTAQNKMLIYFNCNEAKSVNHTYDIEIYRYDPVLFEYTVLQVFKVQVIVDVR